MEVNVLKVAEDSDFATLKQLSDKHDGWQVAYSKKDCNVWTRATVFSNFKMIKVRTEFQDIGAGVVYDVLHDPEYRREWDKFMIDCEDIGCLNPNNDVFYYSLKSLPPLKNRDFVLQRSWLETLTEMMIINHSVCHDSYPPRKGFVRALSYMTGYLVRPLGDNRCQVTYISQSDPKGDLPNWVVNKITTIIAPKIIKKLHQVCTKYPAWKARNNPSLKPWVYPEQTLSVPRIDPAKCVPKPSLAPVNGIIDETRASNRSLASMLDGYS